jgi:hypothetical protein
MDLRHWDICRQSALISARCEHYRARTCRREFALSLIRVWNGHEKLFRLLSRPGSPRVSENLEGWREKSARRFVWLSKPARGEEEEEEEEEEEIHPSKLCFARRYSSTFPASLSSRLSLSLSLSLFPYVDVRTVAFRMFDTLT